MAIIQGVALPFIKDMHNLYLLQLHFADVMRKEHGEQSTEFITSSQFAKAQFDDYSKAYKMLTIAAKGTDIQIKHLAADFDNDMAGIGKRSIEIGDKPYAFLQKQGNPHHNDVPQRLYGAFLCSMHLDELKNAVACNTY